MKFRLHSPYKPTGDQPQAIKKLSGGVKDGIEHQVLLGVTGSGKTFTIANVIEKLQMPTLVISHNKTLAGQLYQEFHEFLPENSVSYFVSYYDYFQPEAYLPQTDTYIQKDADINKEIDKLRLQATTNILTRPDAVVIASVSCIYNIGSPKEYGNFVLELSVGQKIVRKDILKRLVELQYERGDFGFFRGTFRVRGDNVDVFPAYEDFAIRIELVGEKVAKISQIDPLDGKLITNHDKFILYPAKHYMTDPTKYNDVFKKIKSDMQDRVKQFKKQGKDLEAHRIEQKVKYDLEMIKEVGYVNGIENYSRYFDGRNPGDPPYTLLDYFHEAYGDDFLVVIDESHMSVPQIGGMYNGDNARKQTLIDFGFRLSSALDNRPLRFDEFLRRVPKILYNSATPAKWEIGMSEGQVVEQLIRPTGIPDPEVEIRPTQGQIDDLISEIQKRIKKGQRTLVTTLTKRTAEDLASFLKEREMRVSYLHSEVQTLDRSDILDDLRAGKYDVLVGINLLREGLDLPEVSLVAILDADKEGFLRSETSLIQVMGRAARHTEGKVIMYADQTTGSMERAIHEIDRRRDIQLKYNKENNITPKTIVKSIREKIIKREEKEDMPLFYGIEKKVIQNLEGIDADSLTPYDRKKLVGKLQRAMSAAAGDLNFELAVQFRDRIREVESIVK
ncbi:excinuclease ABC subunit B [Candidatus Woesebacteria bacterium]|nr:excinuclease ABC subunit B [Candidatus Woesebacteria bacterium]